MKLIFDINPADIPEAFRPDDPAGLENLVGLLHQWLIIGPLEDKIAPVDGNGLSKKWIDAIRRIHDDRVTVGKLLMDSLAVEK